MLKNLLITGFILLTSYAWGQSILSEGTWHKIGITKSGLYRIDAAFLFSLGVNTNTIDPKKIKVCGINGGMLPQSNAAFAWEDPPENALIDFTDDVGGMGSSEYLLFYAQGPDKVRFDALGNVDYEKNIYSDTAYYFLSVSNTDGKRAQQAEMASQTGQTVDYFHEIITRESEEVNLLGSGRRWLGDEFSSQQSLSKQFEYEIPGLLDSIKFYARLVTQSEGKSSFDITINGDQLSTGNFDSIPTGPGTTYTIRAREKEIYHEVSDNTAASISVDMRYNRAGALLSRGFLDYFILSFQRELTLYGSSTKFINVNASNGTYTYQMDVGNAEDVIVIDITDPVNVELIEFVRDGTKASFSVEVQNAHEYFVFSGSDFPSPEYFGTINNQNLKSSVQYDGLIFTTSLFRNQANRLKQFHQSHGQLQIKVVEVNDVYNEFSSGRKDLTAIRNYIRYVYETGNRLKYVLLMGDCSYDYKFSSNKPDHIPVYESRDSFSPIYSYSSDDYLGFLESHEGQWIENSQNDHDMEIGVGRIPVKTVEEAENVVNKIIRYATSDRTLGKWRNEIAYFADDGDQNIHMDHAVILSNIVQDMGPQFRSKKIFLDNFEQITTPRERSPAATRALEDAIADGLLVLNFIGHGNEFQWMEEETLNSGVISKLNNRHKLPLIVTATCEFGRYDQPVFTSGAENLLLNPNGGAIGLITTTRPVFAHTNLLVNRAFHESMLTKVDNQFPRLGDIIRDTKNNSLSGPVNRNFALLGDPFLRLNYPKYEIGFGELETRSDTLSAFEEYVIHGAIRHSSDTVHDFNGKATVSIIDIPQRQTTRGQENPKFSYLELSNTLFRGEVSVNNGLFRASFILPKNISYKLEKGKILAYAWDQEQLLDASGANSNIVIGGTIPHPVSDNTPPEISLYLNDDSFENGQTVGTNSLFIAKISDQSGINISSNGFNQNITLKLNDREAINLNDFYQADTDTYQKGTVLYPLQNLEPGSYSATLKLWDAHNNSSEKTVAFKVSDQPLIRLYNVMNYPNPVEIYQNPVTIFTFEHDRPGEELIVSLLVYDMSGAVRYSSEITIDDSQSKVDKLEWRPSNAYGDELKQGIYLYRLRVMSTLDGASNEAVRRMIIIN